MNQPEELTKIEEIEEIEEEIEDTVLSKEPEITPEQLKEYIGRVNGINNHIKHRENRQAAAKKKNGRAKASRKKNRKRK